MTGSPSRGGLTPLQRLPLLLLAMVALVIGVGGGLLRLGWGFPLPEALGGQGAAFHGPLMICAFFGTVISLERAVALATGWAYLGPAFSGVGGLALLLGGPPVLSGLLFCAGAAILLLASWVVWRRQPALHTLTLAIAAGCWLVGNALWLAGLAVPRVVPAWMAFLVLTIAGERLELSRILPPSPMGRRLFALPLAGVLVGALLAPWAPSPGSLVFGLGLGWLAWWLLKHDIVRRTVKQQGLTRFIALSLLAGYFWLAVGGLSLCWADSLSGAGPAYDAALHALLLGFVFSMVFGHAPIIVPAVARVRLPYHPLFYLPLGLLHAGLGLRLLGDGLGMGTLRALGGAGNALALLLFVLILVTRIVQGRRPIP